jgi:translocation and assembly module TamB
MTPLRWVGVGIAVLLLALGGFVTWALDTESGVVWIAHTAVKLLDGKLAIQNVQGTIVTPLLVSGVRYRDLEKGVDVTVESASIDLAFSELFTWRAHILNAKVAGVAVALSKPTKPPPDDNKPFTLKPPIELIVDRFSLQSAKVSKDGKPLFEATKALLIGGWANDGVGVKQLAVESPQGRVDIKGTVAQNDTYNGQASGDFRWKQGDYEYIGTLKLTSDQGDVKLNAHLTSPLDARIAAAAKQETSVPWQVDLHVPQFDPRQKLLPGSSIESLSVALRGQGDRENVKVNGELEVNGAKVFVDPIRVTLAEQVVKIEQLVLRDAQRKGVLNVSGNVRLDQKPFYADLLVKWQDVEVPEKVAGQKLATHGSIVAKGNFSEFGTRGDLSIGPPGKLADIALVATGTPEAVVLEKLTIVQKQGDLTASGNIGLKPHISWKIGAEARQFDPGALLADWPGSLGFKLDSDGEILETGPSATLKLDSLAGILRKRQIAGDADLKLTPNKAVAGTLNLRSGRSTIRVTGAGGQTLDLAADFDVASVEDWLPKSNGQINGHVTAQGEWPKIAVKGNVKAQNLAFVGMSARNVTIDADITEPLHPNGSLKASVRSAFASGFEFDTIDLEVSGGEADHSAHLKATGKPVSTEVSVKGQRLPDGWAGTIQSLKLAVPNLEELALREPAQVKVTAQTLEISESCLANSQLSACAQAQQTAAGELQARYVIEHLPLALITALTQPDLGYTVKGTIEGKGDIRRAANGALFGNASLTSASGSVAAEGEEDTPLLSYENFQLAADLNGETAHSTAQMTFNNGGAVQGEVTVGDLSGAAPTLNGNGKLSIGDLSLIGLFVTQLANIKGSASGEATVTGTLAQPNISGSARAEGFGAELPLLGLQLTNGELQVNASGAGAIQINGHLTSGKGEVTLEGGGASIDDITIKATGKEVLAANIPAANVIVAPDLNFTRKAERMDLTGQVTVSSASIDLTKLPKGSKVKQASSDIVVVDDPMPEVKASKAMQLYTHVTVILGEGLSAQQLEKVKLVGFGLDAKLGGQLAVMESPGSDPLGAGEIRLEGTYKAYGQDLTIQTGRLLYANTPLSDPQLDIVAVRVVDEVTAKLTVRGSAQSPLLEVSADPSMPQTAALSYLVTGKPLEQLGSGEGDIVQSAARSLGGAAGNLLAKNLGKRLGVSDVGVTDSSEIGGSAFTVGQYLSPRLYISYGVGLFEPGQVVTLRYRLSRAVNVEASQGPKSQRAGINYKREK